MSLLLVLPETTSGVLATTLGGVTLAASGQETLVGQLATTLGGATLASSGAETIPGQLAASLGGASLAAAGVESITGQLASTLAGATLEAEGTGGEPTSQADAVGYARPFVRLKPKRWPPEKPQEDQPQVEEPTPEIPSVPPASPISSEPWWSGIPNTPLPTHAGRLAVALEGVGLASAGARLLRDDSVAIALELPPIDELAEWRP